MARRELLARRVGRPWVVGGAVAGLALVVGVVVWLLWPDSPARTPRALKFQDFDVCMLTGDRGITGEPAATAWAGLDGVAGEAGVRLSYLSVAGPQTEEQARLFVPTLAQQGCDIVVAVGANQVRAVRALTATYPGIRFLVVESAADVDRVAAQVSSFLPSE